MDFPVHLGDISILENKMICYARDSTMTVVLQCQGVIIIIIIIIKKRQGVQGWERAVNTLSVRRPQPYNTNPQNERRESENSWRENGASNKDNKNALACS